MDKTDMIVYAICGGLLIAIIAFALGTAVAATAPQPLVGSFTDIQGHWAAPYIEQIRLAGLTAGCNANPPMYCPDRPLTRAEAAVLLSRLLER